VIGETVVPPNARLQKTKNAWPDTRKSCQTRRNCAGGEAQEENGKPTRGTGSLEKELLRKPGGDEVKA